MAAMRERFKGVWRIVTSQADCGQSRPSSLSTLAKKDIQCFFKTFSRSPWSLL
jgi:hypothetical protein